MDQLLGDRLVDELLDHGMREMDAMGEFRHRLARRHAHELQHHAEQQAAVDTGLRHAAGHHRCFVHHREELFGRHQAERDQVVAEAAAFRALAFDGGVDVCAADEAAHEEDVA